MQRLVRDKNVVEIPDRLPVLPLKDVIIFPYMVFPLLVGREITVKAVQESLITDNKLIFLSAQRDPLKEDADKDDIYKIGVIGKILQILRLPNGLFKVLVEGIIRAKIKRFTPQPDFLQAYVEIIQELDGEKPESIANLRRIVSLFKEYVKLNREIPDEVLFSIDQIDNPYRLSDFIASHVVQKINVKQRMLEPESLLNRLDEISNILESECNILRIKRDLDEKVHGQLVKSQRDFYLQEQMRIIKKELGEEEEFTGETLKYTDKIKQIGMPKEVEEKAMEEVEKLKKMPFLSPEATVIRNYLDWLIALPWNVRTEDRLDIELAHAILEEDHYGLKKPKERILEYLSVLQLIKKKSGDTTVKVKGPILCFVGPPGVGKTSLAKSIARAMNRNFIRVSLGGIRDEAEIRGHRRTYIGSMPGKIIQSVKRAKSKNPVFLLDEVDKMSMDFRGDPSSALLEVLDPEQNKAFNDHYIEVDYDLSEVFFIATANVQSNIPLPLEDRMEIIELPGYLEHEKVEIAHRFLIQKQVQQNGLEKENIEITKSATQKIIRGYTKEAGVRNLEREIATICRKVAKEIAIDEKKKSGKVSKKKITEKNLEDYLGVPKYLEKNLDEIDGIGVATGLAWTSTGGDILKIEVALMKGKEKFVLTGKLGEVMKESAQAALTYIRSNIEKLGVSSDFYESKEIHIHIPEGAVPKDGPSAGITLATAMISALTRKPVRKDLAMTGEITLLGSVLAIGGLNEKMLAAKRAGIKTVILPSENSKDLKELPEELKKDIEVITVKNIDEVLRIAFR